MVKLIAMVRRNPAMDAEEFHRYWRESHGPLVVRAVGQHLTGYVQHHCRSDNGPDGFDGVAELSFASRDGLRAFFNDPGYLEQVRPDEDRLLDVPRVAWVVTDDTEVLLP